MTFLQKILIHRNVTVQQPEVKFSATSWGILEDAVALNELHLTSEQQRRMVWPKSDLQDRQWDSPKVESETKFEPRCLFQNCVAIWF